MTAPLSGLRVLDLTRILAGPFATQRLADLGADVVKIERPGSGDETRRWGPPFKEGWSAYFLSLNRGKRSVTLNLAHADARPVLEKLVARSDVLVENFRPGTMERLGLGYDAARRLNPGLIYASISGYGQTGHERDRPAFDVVVQGECGFMEMTGAPDGPPTKAAIPIADLAAAMTAVEGILLALYAREKTGRGQHVDVSMMDAMLGLMVFQAQNYLLAGQRPRRRGNEHPSIAPYETYPTADGEIALAVGTDEQWRKLCAELRFGDLAFDERFATNEARVRNRPALNAQLEPQFRARTTEEWYAQLTAAGVPCGRIRNLADVLEDPARADRGMVVELDHPALRKLRMVGVPVRLSDAPSARPLPPPALGEHTDAVLAELDLSPGDIADLHTRGII